MVNTVPGSRVFENAREIMTLVRERLRNAESWEDLLDDADEAEDLAMRDLPGVLAEILRLYDNL